MLGHDDGSMQVVPFSAVIKTMGQDGVAGGVGKGFRIELAETHEERTTRLLIVRQRRRYTYLCAKV